MNYKINNFIQIVEAKKKLNLSTSVHYPHLAAILFTVDST